MDKETPDNLLLQWLRDVPSWQKEALVSHYIFMTSFDSGDFALTGEDSWRYFENRLTKPEFPLRRVSQLLTIRALFTFLLEFSDSNTFPLPTAVEEADKFYPFDAAQFLRTCKRWQELCQTGLSDVALQNWLIDLQG